MSAVATKIIDDVASRVEALFSLAAGSVEKRRGSKTHPILAVGDQIPGWVVSGNDEVPTEPMTARKVFCTYTITVSYLSSELPGRRDESPGIREKQEAVRKEFDRCRWPNVAEVNQSDPRILDPYTIPFKDEKVCCSAVEITVQTIEARN